MPRAVTQAAASLAAHVPVGMAGRNDERFPQLGPCPIDDQLGRIPPSARQVRLSVAVSFKG